MAESDVKCSFAEEDVSSTSFLTPATNPNVRPSGRHSIDFSEKAPQVMEWTSTIAKENIRIIPISTTDIDQGNEDDQTALTPTSTSFRIDHDADLEELQKLTPTLVEVPAADIPDIQNLNLASFSSQNPSYLSSKPYSISGHYARGLEVPSVPSPPSSIIAEPPSPTLSHASLKLSGTYSSTSSNAGEEQDQYQDLEQDSIQVPQSSEHDSFVGINTPSTLTSSSSNNNDNNDNDNNNNNNTVESQPIDKNAFVVPRKEILTKEDLELFHASTTYANLFDLLEALNESVVGVVSTADCYESEVWLMKIQQIITIAST
ncbi:hypothetical protein BGX21_008128 [Mortierella sp. AD011]|nr:hypothetical protein BGX21_008128 [Mortierella sp. AD011]